MGKSEGMSPERMCALLSGKRFIVLAEDAMGAIQMKETIQEAAEGVVEVDGTTMEFSCMDFVTEGRKLGRNDGAVLWITGGEWDQALVSFMQFYRGLEAKPCVVVYGFKDCVDLMTCVSEALKSGEFVGFVQRDGDLNGEVRDILQLFVDRLVPACQSDTNSKG